MAKSDFASLDWLEGIIGFGFRLIAKLSEPFLAFGLIASAVDYGTHGAFLAKQPMVMAAWIVLQAIALEGSGGVALSMSLEARQQGDQVKARLQFALALMLMATGGIMFFAEQARPAPGWEQMLSSPAYIYAMGALRTLVSLGYIAVMRTRHHRFSGAAPEPVQEQELAQRIEQRVEQKLEQMRSSLNITLNQVQAVPSVEQIAALVVEQLEQRRLPRAGTVIAQIEQRTEPLVAALPEPQQNGSDEQEKGRAVQEFILRERGAGRNPTLAQICEAVGVAKNTAIKYRRMLRNEPL